MIKQVMVDAINEQIRKEMYSSNLYLAMAAYYHSINMNGFANWMRIQAQEEQSHALKLFDYLLDRGGKVKLGQINATPTEWESPLAGFEAAYAHEQSITASINDLYDLALQEKDHASGTMLQWFINEQVEEEATVSEIVDRVKLAGESGAGLFFLDSELKSRVFTPPTAE